MKIVKKMNQKGAALVEYVILVGLIGVVGIASVSNLGTEIRDTFNGVSERIDPTDTAENGATPPPALGPAAPGTVNFPLPGDLPSEFVPVGGTPGGTVNCGLISADVYTQPCVVVDDNPFAAGPGFDAYSGVVFYDYDGLTPDSILDV